MWLGGPNYKLLNYSFHIEQTLFLNVNTVECEMLFYSTALAPLHLQDKGFSATSLGDRSVHASPRFEPSNTSRCNRENTRGQVV